MKKRLILGLVFAVTAAGMTFALPEFRISAGGGLYFTSDFGGGVKAPVTVSIANISSTDYNVSIKTPYVGFGAFGFLDVTYAELSMGLWGGGGTMEGKSNTPSYYTTPLPLGDTDFSVLGFDIGLLGKFPFTINEKLLLFPMLGFTGRIMLSVDQDGFEYDDPGDFSAFWFKFGGGLDYAITDHIFLRGELLYGLRFPNKSEEDTVDQLKAYAKSIDRQLGQYYNVTAKPETLLGHGLELKFAVGYKF
jgi:opacity protein-like surface antigen